MSALGCLRAAAPDLRTSSWTSRRAPGRGVARRHSFHKTFEILVGNGERDKTGSLIGLRGVYKQFIPDDRGLSSAPPFAAAIFRCARRHPRRGLYGHGPDRACRRRR